MDATTSASDQHKLANFHLLYLILQMVGVTIIILMASWIFIYLNGLAWSSIPSIQFNWHPLLMSIAMIYLYGNSILIYRGLRYARKRSLKLSHATVFGVIFLLAMIGSLAAYNSHVLADPPIPNLYSLHSWVGLSAMIVFIGQWIAGCVSFLYPQISAPSKAAYMPLHIFFGLTGFVLAVAAALLGLFEKAFFHLKDDYKNLPQEAVLVNTIGLLIILFAGLVLYLATNKFYKRASLEEDAILLTGHEE